jgi:hypothetical protein
MARHRKSKGKSKHHVLEYLAAGTVGVLLLAVMAEAVGVANVATAGA